MLDEFRKALEARVMLDMHLGDKANAADALQLEPVGASAVVAHAVVTHAVLLRDGLLESHRERERRGLCERGLIYERFRAKQRFAGNSREGNVCAPAVGRTMYEPSVTRGLMSSRSASRPEHSIHALHALTHASASTCPQPLNWPLGSILLHCSAYTRMYEYCTLYM